MEELTENEQVVQLTACMRIADDGYNGPLGGGSTRHYVRDWLLPVMEQRGFKFARATKTLGCNAHNGAQPLKCKGNPPCEDISVICIYHKTCPDFQPFKE